VRGPRNRAARQQNQLADRELTGARAELGDPPDPFAAPDRRQRRQLSVFAGQGEQIRRVDRRRHDLQKHLPGLKRRRFEPDRLDHVLRHRATPFVLSPEHRRRRSVTWPA
jgi:hypothetical protein